MDDAVRDILRCFRLDRARECHRLIGERECGNDAFTDLVLQHNKRIVELEIQEDRTNAASGLDLVKLFQVVQDSVLSRGTFILSCGALYNATTFPEIGLPDLLRLYSALLERASRLCGPAKSHDPAALGLVGSRLKAEDEEAFLYLTLATYGLAKRLLHEGRPQDCLDRIREISVPGAPRSEEAGSWIRGARGVDHASLRSFHAVLSAVCDYVRRGPSPFVDGCLADVACPALRPYVLYFRAYVRRELDDDPGPGLHDALRRLPTSGHGDVRSALYNLVGCHVATKKKWHSALEYFHMSLEHQEENLTALWNVASCYRSLGRRDEELRALKLLFEEAHGVRRQRRVVVRPSGPRGRTCGLSRGVATPWLSLAYWSAARLREVGDHGAAASCYGKLAEALGDARRPQDDSSVDDRLPVPDYCEIAEERAHCLLECGRYEECRDVCAEIIDVDSPSRRPSLSGDPNGEIPLRFYRGSALVRLGEYAAALEDFRRASKILSSRMRCACRHGGSAEERETAAKRPRPDEGSADVLLASVAERARAGEGACRACRTESRLLANAAVAHVLEGRPEDALHRLAGALLAWPGNVEAAHNLAAVYESTGRADAARLVRDGIGTRGSSAGRTDLP